MGGYTARGGAGDQGNHGALPRLRGRGGCNMARRLTFEAEGEDVHRLAALVVYEEVELNAIER